MTNVEFLKGPDRVGATARQDHGRVISNCVINLSPDKPAVFGEMSGN